MIEYLNENAALSESAKQKIESIVKSSTFSFSKAENYLDAVSVDKILSFSALIDEIIQANESLTDKELQAKERFDTYLQRRKTLDSLNRLNFYGLN